LARTVAALNGALNEFQNAVQLCKQLESPEVAASVGSLAELQGTLEVILSIVDPPAEPEE
jgi:exonuclease VII small subunit